jgi:hypothetical protein
MKQEINMNDSLFKRLVVNNVEVGIYEVITTARLNAILALNKGSYHGTDFMYAPDRYFGVELGLINNDIEKFTFSLSDDINLKTENYAYNSCDMNNKIEVALMTSNDDCIIIEENKDFIVAINRVNEMFSHKKDVNITITRSVVYR